MLNLVNDFGADPTGVANCDAAVNAWLATGKDIEVPAGKFRIEGTGVAIFEQRKPGVLVGEPGKSIFLLDNNVPNSRCVFHVNPDPLYSGHGDGYGFYGITIQPETYNVGIGLHGIIYNTTATGQYLRQPFVEKCGIHQMSGNAIVSVNSNQDGIAMLRVIANQYLLGGIALNNCGDSTQIKENIIAGAGIGVFVSPVPGATRLSIVDNNISSVGGCVYLQNPNSYHLQGNNMEQNAGYNGGVGAMVFVQNALGGSIENNQFQSMGNTSCLRRLNCVNDRSYGNIMHTTTAHKHIWDTGGSGNSKNDTCIEFTTGAIVAGYF